MHLGNIDPYEPSYFKSRRYDPRPKFSIFSEMKSLIKKTFMGKIISSEAVIVREKLFLIWRTSGMAISALFAQNRPKIG